LESSVDQRSISSAVRFRGYRSAEAASAGPLSSAIADPAITAALASKFLRESFGASIGFLQFRVRNSYEQEEGAAEV
jgi:hypothetical protein